LNPDDNLFRGGAYNVANTVVFDLETTGLSPSNDEIIQIAAVRIDSGKVRASDRFFSYVRPTRRISPFITDLTGITDDDVEDAPPALDVLKQFAAFCGDSLLVAHNGHAFDIPFIRSACDRRRLLVREARYVDSMHLSWMVWGREAGLSHSLDAVLSRLRVGTGGIRRHDARGDVTILAKCYLKLVDRLGRAGWQSPPKIYTCALPFAIAQDAAKPAAKKGRCKAERTEAMGYECTICGGSVDEDVTVHVFVNPPDQSWVKEGGTPYLLSIAPCCGKRRCVEAAWDQVKQSTIGKIEAKRPERRRKRR